MKVIVFGASGNVGKKVVAELIERGHEVTGFVYGGMPAFVESSRLRIVQGNVKKLEDVQRALKGHDAVISCLGSWGTKSKDILSMGMKSIILAMESEGIKRIISLTGAAAKASSDKPNLSAKISRLSLIPFGYKILKDGEEHIRLLEQSNLDWTVLRSPVMKEEGSSGYELSDKSPAPWATISRSDVAQAMVDLLETDNWINDSPIIHRP